MVYSKKPEMPNIRTRTYRSGRRIYFVDYFDPVEGKRIREAVSPRRVDAQKRASQIYRQLMARYLGEPEKSVADISIESVIEAYFSSKAHPIRPLSLKRYRIYTRNFQSFMSANFPTVLNVSQVRRIHLEEFLQHLLYAGQTPGTINAELRILKRTIW